MPYSLKKIGLATATQAGLLSAEDKRRLDAGPYRALLAKDFINFFAKEYYNAELTAEQLSAWLGPDVTLDVLGECVEKGLKLGLPIDLEVETGFTMPAVLPVSVFGFSAEQDGQPAGLYLFTAELFFAVLDGIALLEDNGSWMYSGILFGNGHYFIVSQSAYLPLTVAEHSRATSLFSSSSMGLCPQAPSAEPAQKFLRGDGTWAAPPEQEIPEIPEATTEQAGLLSAADKAKLDSLTEGGSTLPAKLYVDDSQGVFSFPNVGDPGASWNEFEHFPFEGKNDLYEIRGSGAGPGGNGEQLAGTFRWNVDDYMSVSATLDIVIGSGPTCLHVIRHIAGSYTQASDGTYQITWNSGWMKPEAY